MKIVHELNSHLAIFSPPRVIENPGWYFLLWRDNLQKTAVGCPWFHKSQRVFFKRTYECLWNCSNIVAFREWTISKPGNREKQIIAKPKTHSLNCKKMKTECSVKEDKTKAGNCLDHKNWNRSTIKSKILIKCS